MGENSAIRKVLICSCRVSRYAWAWTARFVKVRFLKCRQCKAQKNFDAKLKRLGMEIYSLYKQGETDYHKSQVVQQQLGLAEAAEKVLFDLYDRREQMDLEYQESKQAIARMGHREED